MFKEILYILPSENLVNELHDWIEKQPHVIKYPNEPYSKIFKFNDTLLKKHKHLLQISVHDMHNDLILPVSKGVFHGARNEYGRVYIGDMSLRNNMPNNIK